MRCTQTFERQRPLSADRACRRLCLVSAPRCTWEHKVMEEQVLPNNSYHVFLLMLRLLPRCQRARRHSPILCHRRCHVHMLVVRINQQRRERARGRGQEAPGQGCLRNAWPCSRLTTARPPACAQACKESRRKVATLAPQHHHGRGRARLPARPSAQLLAAAAPGAHAHL